MASEGEQQRILYGERSMGDNDMDVMLGVDVSEGDADRKVRARNSVEWSESATTLLLEAFGEKHRALERGNLTSKMWGDIATRVNRVADGAPKTQEQCRIKVDNLKKRYKVEREKRLVSGTSRWMFYDVMDELIGATPSPGRAKRLEDVNAPALMALFEGYDVPPHIIDAMLQEDVDECTLINSRDIGVLLDQLLSKYRLHIKLGPVERIKQAVEAAKERKNSMSLVIQR